MRPSRKPIYAAALFCFTCTASFLACSSPEIDDLIPSGEAGGGHGGAGGGHGGSGGAGGSAGERPDGGAGCESCAGATPICVDDKECAATCPDARAACATAGPEGQLSCCEAGAQCCSAAVFGYRDGDRCLPQDEACPVACPDGVTTCPTEQTCQLDPSTGTYVCAAECPAELSCDQNLCCPLGTACVQGECPLPDIKVDEDQLRASVELTTRTFASDSCEMFEGCIAAPGARKLLRFDLRTPNIGDGDLFLGRPDTGNPLFEYSSCHGHYHFNGYANYRLRDLSGQEVGSGHKQAFCLLDLDRDSQDAAPAPRYDCGYQGIQAGWADIYDKDLPCQWVDVTDVPPGDYILEIELNRDHALSEADYTNNVAAVPVTIPANTCPNGCRPADEVCCQPGDPCGWGADGSCDCGGYFDWDASDCSSCLDGDDACTSTNSCPGGCSENTGACCDPSNPCSLERNGTCDCGGAYPWDTEDCQRCTTADPDCPTNSCPRGCSPYDPRSACCSDPAGCSTWMGDGECDCGGAAWDAEDCGTCISSDPDCGTHP